MQVWAVWEALGVSEDERSKVRNLVAALSAKPDAALQVEPLRACGGSAWRTLARAWACSKLVSCACGPAAALLMRFRCLPAGALTPT